MKKVLRLWCFVGALLFFAFTGCSLPLEFKGETPAYYVLDRSGEQHPRSTSLPFHLRIRDVTSSRLVNTQRIVYSREEGERAYYQFAFWGEIPSKRFAYLVQRELEEMLSFSSVSQAMDNVAADLQLNLDLIDFYHDASSRPGAAVMLLNAQLSDLKTRQILATRYFERKQELESYDVDGAVKAFNLEVNEIIDELVTWLTQTVESGTRDHVNREANNL